MFVCVLSSQELSSALFAPVVKPVDAPRRIGTGRSVAAPSAVPSPDNPALEDMSTSQLFNSSILAGLFGGIDLNSSAKLEDGMTGGKVAIAGMLAMMEEHAKLSSEAPTARTVSAAAQL